MQVAVRNNDVEKAMKVLRRRLQREGVFREMKERQAYEKPSERRVRKEAAAVARERKARRKLAEAEGVIPSKKKPVLAPAAPRN